MFPLFSDVEGCTVGVSKEFGFLAVSASVVAFGIRLTTIFVGSCSYLFAAAGVGVDGGLTVAVLPEGTYFALPAGGVGGGGNEAGMGGAGVAVSFGVCFGIRSVAGALYTLF